MKDKDRLVKFLGFPSVEPVTSFPSIAHMFSSSKSRCGIYLLEFSNSVFYIGQAVEVVRRFSQHRKNHDNIVGFAFIKVLRNQLDDIEKKLIFDAENLGFILSNTIHATTVIGETDLDLIFDQDEQTNWLENPGKINAADSSSVIEMPENIVQRARHKFEKISNHRNADLVVDLLKTYTNLCIPVPKRTELSFWSMSCMPATASGKLPRYSAVNMGVMEVFVIGYTKQSKDELWGFVNVASDVLFPENHFRKKLAFKVAFPSIGVYKTNYKDAGQHQISLQASNAKDLRRLLSDKRVQMAAAQLNLRLMRKRPTIYSRYHCSDLARKCF